MATGTAIAAIVATIKIVAVIAATRNGLALIVVNSTTLQVAFQTSDKESDCISSEQTQANKHRIQNDCKLLRYFGP